ncbi:MAG: SGNH/GDSL hydrolase family protein [Candidatus Omnitrophota bacterium]
MFILLFLEIAFRLYALVGQMSSREIQQDFIERFAVPDSYGIVRPHVQLELRSFFPTGKLIDYPVNVSTNSYGMRMREISLKKTPNVIRIAVMGDSCTFGWMVPEENVYSRVLEILLNQNGAAKYEVLNFGVPGYTSFHGLKQYDRLVKPFQPDIIIPAFGFNDSYESRFSEAELFARMEELHLSKGLSGTALFFYDHSRLAKWLIGRLRSRGKSLVEAEYRRRAQQNLWFPRVSREEYIANIKAIYADAQSYGAKMLLLHLDLPNSWVKEPLRQLSKELPAPLLDAQSLFEASAAENSQPSLPANLMAPGVQPGVKSNSRALLLRVYVPLQETVKDRIYVAGNNPSGGDWMPNAIALYDDGANGDEQADDRVWSLRIETESQILMDYAFTNSGPAGKWQETEPIFENTPKAIRHYYRVDLKTLPPGSFWVSPIHVLNQLPYQNIRLPQDPIHPNKQGHRLIAEKLGEMVLRGK